MTKKQLIQILNKYDKKVKAHAKIIEATAKYEFINLTNIIKRETAGLKVDEYDSVDIWSKLINDNHSYTQTRIDYIIELYLPFYNYKKDDLNKLFR